MGPCAKHPLSCDSTLTAQCPVLPTPPAPPWCELGRDQWAAGHTLSQPPLKEPCCVTGDGKGVPTCFSTEQWPEQVLRGRRHKAQRGRADPTVSVPCSASATRLGGVNPPQVGCHISRPQWGLWNSTSHPTGSSQSKPVPTCTWDPGSFGRAGLSCSPQSPLAAGAVGLWTAVRADLPPDPAAFLPVLS